jgi:hypothetical protein
MIGGIGYLDLLFPLFGVGLWLPLGHFHTFSKIRVNFYLGLFCLWRSFRLGGKSGASGIEGAATFLIKI